MPTSIARYGARDAGLDDWCSLGAYEWLSAHGGLVTRVDDISGEHGRNIGHATHDRGTDIDMFHFTSLNPGSGTANYEALRKKVKEAAGGDDEALAVVTDWFASERAGLALLLVRADVERMFGGLGDATQGVSAGWYRDLLRSGRTPASGTAVIDTGLGAWTATGASKLAHNHVHNNHYHIDLRESAIGD